MKEVNVIIKIIIVIKCILQSVKIFHLILTIYNQFVFKLHFSIIRVIDANHNISDFRWFIFISVILDRQSEHAGHDAR